ncbi:MAG: hypothetical protein HY657_07560 [Acidobacteria bacterium]|nr:hypothetical protein [Acidobacteriota bacterium]
MSRRFLRIAAVNVAAFLVLAELAALALYYVDTGALFYAHRKTYTLIPETTEGRLTADALHPYFGPTHTPGHPFDIPDALREPQERGGTADEPRALATNNFGFVSPYDFPFPRTGPDRFLVGLFGGSVGVWFCQIGADRLVSMLKQHAFFRTRQVIPLCFSHEGYKQPQQALLLAYFLSIGQAFDLVINIDGFNEVALGSLNQQRGVDVSMPSPMHLDPLINLIDRSTLTPEKLASLAAIARDKERLNGLVERIGRNRIALVNFVLERLYARTSSRYVAELGRFANLPSNPSPASIVRVTPAVKPREGATVFEDIARSWAEASLLMQDMLASRRATYVHVLQPNQYYGSRRFGAEEARVALSDGSPFKESVERGYPALVDASAPLKERVAFIDATGIFDAEPSPVYMDDCCHYTLRGNQRLADAIAARVLAAPGPWNAASP